MAPHVFTRHIPQRKHLQLLHDDTDTDFEPPAIVEHPDGYYWMAGGGLGEVGPFATYASALADRDAGTEESIAPGAALQEAERDLGVADWIDTETDDPTTGALSSHLRNGP